MKKHLVFCFALFCLGTVSVNAQKEWNPAPFKHLAVGVGVGSAGADIELATTLGYHFQLRAGLSALPYSISIPYDMGLGDMFSEMDPSDLNAAGIDPSSIPNEVEVTAGLGLMNGKVLMDIYPFKKAGIHLTAGVYFGNDELLNLGLQMPEEFMDALDDISSYDSSLEDDPLFGALPKDGSVNMSLTVKKVKPYLGFGLSRAVPKRRLSLNVDCGVMFHGNPVLDSNISDINDMLSENGVTDVVNKVVVYPVVSFRLVGRIF